MITLDRHAFTPIYYQLAEAIKGRIECGEIEGGGQLPPEDVLADQHGVSRKTVRKTLARLANEGYVVRLKGKGTFALRPEKGNRVVVLALSNSLVKGYHRTINDMIGGVALSATESGVDLRVLGWDQLPDIIERRSVGAVNLTGIVFGRYREEANSLARAAVRTGVPVVLEGEGDDGFVSVEIDNVSPIKSAFDRLRNLGHERVGYVTWLFPGSRHYQIRAETALGMMREGLLGEDGNGDYLEINENDAAVADRSIADYLGRADLPTAVVCGSDVLALKFLKEARRRGVSVPGELSIIGFDDVPEAALADPALSTFRQNYFELGKRSLRTLLDLAEDFRDRPAKMVVVPEYVDRGSVAPKAENLNEEKNQES